MSPISSFAEPLEGVRQAASRRWQLHRRVSSTPLGVGLALGALAAATLVIALAFSSIGAWPVLPFAGIEILALAAALVIHARQLGDADLIAIADGRLRVEKRSNGRVEQRCDWPAGWVRIDTEAGVGGTVRLSYGRDRVAVAACLAEPARRRFADELKSAIKN
ncbi:hypothetical protein BH09PSE6_BH09PSE6_30330 [soil metagenome]